MALDTFHANPCLGGFQEDSVLCQTVKELVDNAVDACRRCDKETMRRRVRVSIEPMRDTELLEINVTDNGCGMKDIQRCITPFATNKRNSQLAGRFGMGLTLALLHTQRVYEHCCASIQSATSDDSHWTTVKCVLKKNGKAKKQRKGRAKADDSMQDEYDLDCKLVESARKQDQSGTSVRLVLAVPDWKSERVRLEQYFRAFGLVNLGDCTIQVVGLLKITVEPRECPQKALIQWMNHTVPDKLDACTNFQQVTLPLLDKENATVTLQLAVFPAANTDTATATCRIVRLVNRTPLLETTGDATPCAIGDAIRKSSMWKTYNLDVSGVNGSTLEMQDAPHVAQCQTTFPEPAVANNKKANEVNPTDWDDWDLEVEPLDPSVTAETVTSPLIPAGKRLGRWLLVVHVESVDEAMPLDKSGILEENGALRDALEQALDDLLTDLPTVYSPARWKEWECEHIYIPATAASMARILCHSQTAKTRRALEQIVGWGKERSSDYVYEEVEIIHLIQARFRECLMAQPKKKKKKDERAEEEYDDLGSDGDEDETSSGIGDGGGDDASGIENYPTLNLALAALSDDDSIWSQPGNVVPKETAQPQKVVYDDSFLDDW